MVVCLWACIFPVCGYEATHGEERVLECIRYIVGPNHTSLSLGTLVVQRDV